MGNSYDVVFFNRGNGGMAHLTNDAVLYREREGGYKLARVVKVDNAVDPPGYVVEVDGAERSTEASRLAPAPKPRRRSDGGNNGGSDSDGCVDASAAFAPPSHARGGAEGGADRRGVPAGVTWRWRTRWRWRRRSVWIRVAAITSAPRTS